MPIAASSDAVERDPRDCRPYGVADPTWTAAAIRVFTGERGALMHTALLFPRKPGGFASDQARLR